MVKEEEEKNDQLKLIKKHSLVSCFVQTWSSNDHYFILLCLFFSLHVSQNFVSNWSTWLLIEKIDKVRKRKKLGQIELVDNSKVLNDKMIFKEI
jgi:hypothetical protein